MLDTATSACGNEVEGGVDAQLIIVSTMNPKGNLSTMKLR